MQNGHAHIQCVLAYLLLCFEKNLISPVWEEACASSAPCRQPGSCHLEMLGEPRTHQNPTLSSRSSWMPPFVLKLDAKISRATCPKGRGRLGVRNQRYLQGKGILLLSALQKVAQSMHVFHKWQKTSCCCSKWGFGKWGMGWIEQRLMGPFSHPALMLSPVLPPSWSYS